MKTAWKWLGRGTLALVALALVACGIVYAASERKLRATYDVPLVPFVIPTDSASVARGERLARIRGCYNGCHGEAANGQLFNDDFAFGRIKSPDLTRVVASMSPGELERVIRRGVRTNGESVLIMPSDMFYHLSDDDLGSILAFLRSLPTGDGPETSFRLGPMARLMIALGEFVPMVEEIDTTVARTGPGDGTDPTSLGRYLARTACTECHGQDHRGVSNPAFSTPSLAISQAYGPDEFMTLLSEGVATGGRELDLMAVVARKRFALFTPEEVSALHGFLVSEFGSAAEPAD